MRDLHSLFLGAVLGGEGLQGVADLAAAEAGGPVAIVLPARGLAATSPEGLELNGDAAVEAPIRAGSEELGAVLVLAGANGHSSEDGGPPVDRAEVARAAALAALTELAVADARDEVEHDLRASLIEDLRAGAGEGEDVARRAGRLGCELTRGALALVAEVRSRKPRGAAALIESEWPGSLAERIGGRVYAILPARGGDDAPERARTAAVRLVGRLRAHGPAAVSSFYPDPAELEGAMREAELVLEVVRRDERLAEQIETGAGDGVYRLLFRALISDPGEVRSFYEDTVAPVVEYDRQYRSELLPTLDAYLAQDCNMNATAREIYAHRHTVAYRLERVRELSGLDPTNNSDRERLGLGIKAYRILARTLHR
jgi:sugar diacid utilization regulator